MFQIHFHKFSTDVQIYQIFYVILAVLGIYLLYAVRKMRKNEEISPLILPEEELAKCRDKKGLIAEISRPVSLLGAAALIYGIFGVINSLYSAFGWGYEVCGVCLFFASYGWYSKEMRRGADRYCK